MYRSSTSFLWPHHRKVEIQIIKHCIYFPFGWVSVLQPKPKHQTTQNIPEPATLPNISKSLQIQHSHKLMGKSISQCITMHYNAWCQHVASEKNCRPQALELRQLTHFTNWIQFKQVPPWPPLGYPTANAGWVVVCSAGGNPPSFILLDVGNAEVLQNLGAFDKVPHFDQNKLIAIIACKLELLAPTCVGQEDLNLETMDTEKSEIRRKKIIKPNKDISWHVWLGHRPSSPVFIKWNSLHWCLKAGKFEEKFIL